MKKNKLFALLFSTVIFASVAVADYTQDAVALAANSQASMGSICSTVADAVKHDAQAPSKIFADVVAARASWTSAQVAGLYKSVLMASPALSSSFMDDVDAFEQAGKPGIASVDAGASEGVKLLAVLYSVNITGVNADVVLASVVADTMGASLYGSVSPLRDAAASGRRTQPAKPTPPAASLEN